MKDKTSAVEWICQNFPPPQISVSEARQIQILAIRKALFLRAIILGTYRTITAIRRMEAAAEKIKVAYRRPTFEEALECLQADDGELFFTSPPGPGFVDDLERITAEGFNAYKDSPRDVDDLLVVYQVYHFVLPQMQSCAASLLLRLGLAEAQLIHLNTHTVAMIQKHEMPDGGPTKLSKGVYTARGMRKSNNLRIEAAVAIFNRLTETKRAKFLTDPRVPYAASKREAERDRDEAEREAKKNNESKAEADVSPQKSATDAWFKDGKHPYFETWQGWIKEELFQEVATDTPQEPQQD